MKKYVLLLLGFVFPVGASINPAGQLVTRFGDNGTATLSLAGNITFNDIAIDSQQRIIVVGSLQDTGALVVRFLPTGELDISFNGVGYKTFFYNNTNDQAFSISLLGNVIYVGCYNGAGGTFGFVASFNDDGSFNQSWGTQGIFHFSTPSMRLLFNINVQSNGKVLVCGAQSDFLGHLARINAVGSALDTTFNATGTPGYQTITGYAALNFVVANNDSIYVVVSDNVNSAVYAFTQTGFVDTSYHGTGVSQIFADCSLDFIVIQSNGKILLAGNDQTYAIVKRLTTAGLLDTSFGQAGTVIVDPGLTAGFMVTIDDSFFVVSNFILDAEFFYYVKAYTSNGSTMTTFGHAGAIRLDSMTDNASSIVSAQYGTIVIGGNNATSGILQEYTQYNPGQVGFTDTSLSLVPNTLGESTIAVTPVYRVPVTNQELLPAYVRTGLTGF